MRKQLKTKQDYLQLIEKMIEHDKHYYDEDQPMITDYEYDQLFKLLESFEKDHPDLIHPASPTKRVSEALKEGFQKRAHLVPMLSIANTYSEDELKDFIERVYRLLETANVDFIAELKMDGTAVSLRYEEGRFVRALTRGNGKIGDVVTANVRTIKNLPLTLKGENLPKILEIRAEVFMNISIFLQLNRKRQEMGFDTWANPRNAAAGSLKLLDPKEVSLRKLNLVCYGIVEGADFITTQYEALIYLKKLGLPVSKEDYIASCKNFEEILSFIKKIETFRKDLFFEIDGIVVKVNDLKAHKRLGVTGKHPRYAVAFKFAPEQAFTQIQEITVQVGRTGVLTPVAELKPVVLQGSTISRATLHNEDEVRKKDIRVGDWVVIEKGGDVIPKVVKVDFSKRKDPSLPWKMPKKCPSCSSEIVHRKEEVAARCINRKCGAQRLRRIIFFASKQAMDIEHLGQKVIEQLVDLGLISRISDIYLLDETSLLQLEGFKEKSAQNLLTSIEKSKKCPLSRFIMGLAIPYVGSETADLLSRYFGSLQNIQQASFERLVEIEGIGEKVAKAILDFFSDEKNLEEIELLFKHGVKPQKPTKQMNHPFLGKIFVLTGSLEKYTRQEAINLIKERGGKVSSSVSRKTDYILLGKEPGSKYTKAKALNIAIFNEEEFEKRL